MTGNLSLLADPKEPVHREGSFNRQTTTGSQENEAIDALRCLKPEVIN